MADRKKRGFKVIEKSYEELERQIWAHRMKILMQSIAAAVALILVIVAVNLFYALRSFDSYEVKNTVEREGTGIARYAAFQNYLLEYSNDGISCLQTHGELLWNQSFEMISPQIEICGEYLVVYDAGGTKLYIMTKAGLQKSIETSSPIQTVCIAEQGTVAVLMKENQESQVKLFDKKGNELANGKFYSNKGAFPVDIALSKDATKLAVDMVDISKGTVSTTISFYNFGSVGQSEIDNHVGSYTFEGLLVSEVTYVSESKMIAMGTEKLLIFEGGQKPELVKEVVFEEEVLSYFHNDKYIGIVYDDIENNNSWHMKIMDMRGSKVMQNKISIAYDSVEFLSNGEICVRNENECEIFTMNSIIKFTYTFDEEVYKILSGDDRQNYTFVYKNTIEEVKLK